MRYIPRGYTKEDLRTMYLEQNMKREDIANRYNIPISCGDHLIDENNHLKDVRKKIFEKAQAKQKCMEEHQVVMWKKSDIQFAIDYVFRKYGKNYLKSFKKRSERALKN